MSPDQARLLLLIVQLFKDTINHYPLLSALAHSFQPPSVFSHQRCIVRQGCKFQQQRPPSVASSASFVRSSSRPASATSGAMNNRVRKDSKSHLSGGNTSCYILRGSEELTLFETYGGKEEKERRRSILYGDVTISTLASRGLVLLCRALGTSVQLGNGHDAMLAIAPAFAKFHGGFLSQTLCSSLITTGYRDGFCEISHTGQAGCRDPRGNHSYASSCISVLSCTTPELLCKMPNRSLTSERLFLH